MPKNLILKCRFCADYSLDKSLVAGKIVFCDKSNRGGAALAAEAAGSITPDDGKKSASFAFPIPTSCLDASDASKILQYMKSARYFSCYRLG